MATRLRSTMITLANKVSDAKERLSRILASNTHMNLDLVTHIIKDLGDMNVAQFDAAILRADNSTTAMEDLLVMLRAEKREKRLKYRYKFCLNIIDFLFLSM